MEYRLLGPLEVVADDGLLEIRSARQRIVLSMLLFHANRVVPLDRLVDAVWDIYPPATARSQIQTCISALRRLLGTATADDQILTHPAGYGIRVSHGGLDIMTFQRLVSRGRAEAADQKPEDAVLHLREALALWRGWAAAGVDSKLVHEGATRLNETRLEVIEDCIELELGLGLHHQLTGELRELVSSHPLRERLRALHILALYRSSRQADALESYQEICQILKENLGLGPGAELADLQQAILANDRSLELQPEVPRALRRPAHAAAVPHQLPTATADFTGREDVLEGLAALLTASEREADGPGYLPIVTITGKGGVGKTALALQAAHAVRPRYPDGQLFAQLQDAAGQPVNAYEVLGTFLRALGLTPTAVPANPSERATLYRSYLGEHRILIVLDDAESASQVTPLIPGSPNCGVVVTSRKPLTALPGASHFELDDLDEQASVRLLGRIVGHGRVRAEPGSAIELVRLCGCLPLALRIVAAKLAARTHWRIDQMVSRLADESRRLDELALSGAGVRATLSLSYQNLGADARRLFTRLGLLGTTDFAAWIGAPLLDMDADVAAEILDTLVDARLVEVQVRENGSPRFRLHDLVRLYAVERLESDEPAGDRAAALERLLSCWLHLATEAHRRTYGGDFAVLHGRAPRWPLPVRHAERLLVKPLRWLREEQAGLVWAVIQAGQAGLAEVCWDLAVTSVTLFESEYQVDEWRKTHEAALMATRRAGNLRGEAAILYSLGILAVGERLADAPAYLDPALQLFDHIGDAHGKALTLAIMAFVDRLGGRYERSLERYQAALVGFRAVDDRVSEVDVLTNMAQIHVDRGDFDTVERLLGHALMLCRTLRAPRVEAQTEHRLGEFLLRKGDFDRAERTFESVLAAVREEGDLVGEAYALQGLGTARTRKKRYAVAKADLDEALELSRQVGDNLVHGRALLACAELHLALNEPQAAGALLNNALAVISELGPATIWRARFLELKARLDELAGHGTAAAATLQAALELVVDLDPALTRNLMAGMGRARQPWAQPRLAEVLAAMAEIEDDSAYPHGGPS